MTSHLTNTIQYLLSAEPGSRLVERMISSIKLSGFTLVTSTRPCGAPSSVAFLRLSIAAFARSKDPVSLNPDPELGFLQHTSHLIQILHGNINIEGKPGKVK